MTPGNAKGWVAFLVLMILIIGGAMGTSHVLHTTTPAMTISSIYSGNGGSFDGNGATYYLNLTSPAATLNFTITLSTPTSSGNVSAILIPPSLVNMTHFNTTFNATYLKYTSSPYNMSAANATAEATTVALENSTYTLFKETFVNTTVSGSTASITFSVTLNNTAMSLLRTGQSVSISFSASSAQYGVVGAIILTKDY